MAPFLVMRRCTLLASPATVTTILDKLELGGLVVRYRNEDDRRVVHSRLTDRGAQMLDAAPPFLHERFVSRFAQLDAARQAVLIGALEDVAEMMGAPAPREGDALPAPLPLEAEIGPLETPAVESTMSFSGRIREKENPVPPPLL